MSLKIEENELLAALLTAQMMRVSREEWRPARWRDLYRENLRQFMELEKADYAKQDIATGNVYIDFGPDYSGLARERVTEWARLPSGRIVVMSDAGDSMWFDKEGRNPKGSFLTPWPLGQQSGDEAEHTAKDEK